MKIVKAKTTKTAPKVALKGAAAKAAPKGSAAKVAAKETAVKGKAAKGKKPKKVLPKGTPMSIDDTLWRLVNRPIAPKKPAPDVKEKATTEDDAS
jgi:hypothetical protein